MSHTPCHVGLSGSFVYCGPQENVHCCPIYILIPQLEVTPFSSFGLEHQTSSGTTLMVCGKGTRKRKKEEEREKVQSFEASGNRTETHGTNRDRDDGDAGMTGAHTHTSHLCVRPPGTDVLHSTGGQCVK